jgi:predicted glycosyltransferase
VHIPSRDSIEERRARQWGRRPFVAEDSRIGSRLRQQLIRSTLDAFQPHAIITDYLPLGMEDELAEFIVSSAECRKYFISRGILGDPEQIYKSVLTPSSLQAIRDYYHMILVMSDFRIIDMAKEYSLEAAVADKLVYVGYATEFPPLSRIAQARKERGLGAGDKWVICTAGGGKEGEALIERCWEIAQIFPECHFDIVIGPRSRLSLESDVWTEGRRIRLVHVDSQQLPVTEAAADIVICRGGYNSLMESCVGNAAIIVAPIVTDYEQVHHARRLSTYRDITMVDALSELDLALESVLQRKTTVENHFQELDLNGLQLGASLMLSDLTLNGAGSTASIGGATSSAPETTMAKGGRDHGQTNVLA